MYTTPSVNRRTVAPSGLIATSSLEFYPARCVLPSTIPAEKVSGGRKSGQRRRAVHGARNGSRHSLGCRRSQRSEVRPVISDGQADEDVAVGRQVRWRQRALEALEARPGDACGLGFSEDGGRGDDADRGIDGTEAGRRRAGLEGGGGVHQSAAIGRIPRAGDELPRDGIADVADGVDYHERGRDDAVPLHLRDAQPAPHGALDTVELAHRRARSGADVAFLHRPRPGGYARGVAHRAIRPRAMVAHVQIEDDGARDMRHDGAGDAEAPAALFEKLHRAPDGLEPEGAAPGENNAVERRRDVTRIEEFDAVDAGRPAGDLERAYRGLIRQNGRASGE